MSVNNFFKASAEDFKKIPGSPIVYFIGRNVYRAFSHYPKLIKLHYVCSGLQTGDNDLHLRQWFEVTSSEILSDEGNIKNRNHFRWYFHRKGGEFRKWYGNIDYVINWLNEGEEIRSSKSARPQNLDRWFSTGVTWSHTSSSSFSARLLRRIDTINVEGPSAFADDPKELLGYMSSKVAFYFMGILNPTLHFLVGSVSQLPFNNNVVLKTIINRLVDLSKSDWDFSEISWDFTSLSLLNAESRVTSVKDTYKKLRQHWQVTTLEMQRLEEENNRIFIEAYGLEDELTPEVSLKEITLTCNPYYRYGVDAEDSKEPGVFPINQTIENRLQSDTMKEFLSYAVGCMFGRYSLDKEGLILANAGDGIEEYLNEVPKPTFKPDESGILPLTEADDFTDDLPSQFYRFLRITFGEEHYHENLRFIEDSIGKSVRYYFLKEFFKDHVQRYKKRPIYWMVTSPRGSFRAFIYLHRYNKDTVGQILNDYVRPFEKKLESRIAECRHISTSSSSGTKEKIQAQKDVDRFEKALQEITEWDAKVLRPLALERIELDLDDGVKVNYAKLGAILEPVKGLNG